MTASMTAPPIEQVAPNIQTRVKAGDLAAAQNGLLGTGAVLLIGTCAFGMTRGGDEQSRFYFSYLTAYVAVLGIGLGSLLFMMIQHITRSGWSVVVRRVAENTAGTLPWMLLLFLPIVFGHSRLFEWAVPERAEEFHGKAAFLNPTFFFIRVGIYFAVWIGLATFFRRSSLAQDHSGDPAITLRMARVAAPGILLFALSVTFAAFDWIMTLNPHWFSTIFGLTYFSGSYMAFFAFTILLCQWLGRSGYLRDAINVEHYHDLGKLMFVFLVFWTYTNFSQYMLIWYANLPDETQWFAVRREHGGWGAVGTLLIVGHFFVPFAFLMSRHIKRNPLTLAAGAIFLLVIHWIDMQYLVLPNFHPEHAGEAAAHARIAEGNALFGPFTDNLGEWLHGLQWTDFTCVLGMLSLIAGATVLNVRRHNLLPTRDPRLAESLAFLNQ